MIRLGLVLSESSFVTFLSGPGAAGTLLGNYFYMEGPSTTQRPAKDNILVQETELELGSLRREHLQVHTTPRAEGKR